MMNSTDSRVDFQRCDCCPFGLHIDVDFVDFATNAFFDKKSEKMDQRRMKIIESDFKTSRDDKINKIRRPKSKTHEELDRQMLEALRTEEYYKSLLANECKDEDDDDNSSLVFNNDRFNQSFNGFSSIANSQMAPERSPSVFSDKMENLSANHHQNNSGMATFLSDSLENLMSDFDETLARSSALSNYANLNESNKVKNDSFNNSRKFSEDLDKNNNLYGFTNELPVRSSSVAAHYESGTKNSNSVKRDDDTFLSPQLARRKIDSDRATLTDPFSNEDKFAFFDRKMDTYVSPNDLNRLNNNNDQTSFNSTTLPKQQQRSSSTITTNSKTFDYNVKNDKEAALMDNSTRKENYGNITAKIAANMEQVSNRLKRLNSPEFSPANYKSTANFAGKDKIVATSIDKDRNVSYDQENVALERLRRLEQEIKNRPPLIDTKILKENIQNTAQSNDLLKIKTSGEKFRDKLSYYENIGGAKPANGHAPETPKRTYSHDRMRDYQVPKVTNFIAPPPQPPRSASVTPYAQKYAYRSLFSPENGISSSSTSQLKSPQLFHSLNRFVAKQANNQSNDAIYRRTPPTLETKFANSNDEYVSDSEVALGDRYLSSTNFGDRRFNVRYSSLRRPRLSQTLYQTTAREDFSTKNNLDGLQRERGDDFSENYTNFRRAMDDLNENYRKFDKSRENVEKTSNLELVITKDDVKNKTQLPCQICSKNAAKAYKSISCYTGPLPESKPCVDCENLRRKLQLAEFKPVVFDVSTSVPLCTCIECLKMRAKIYVDRSTSPVRKPSPVTRGVMAELPTKPDTCEHCTEMRRKMFVGFGVNTEPKKVSSVETGTDLIELANRQTNTESAKKRLIGTNTEPMPTKDVGSVIDKSIFHRLGYFSEKSANTDQKMVVNIGFNTDPWNPFEDKDRNESKPNRTVKSDALVQTDIGRLTSSSIGIDANQFSPSKIRSRDESSNTEKSSTVAKNVAVSTDPRKTKDRSIDCRAICCDASVNTVIDKTDKTIVRLSGKAKDDPDCRKDTHFEAIRQNLAAFETEIINSDAKSIVMETQIEEGNIKDVKNESPSTNDETGYSISSPDVDEEDSSAAKDKEYMISSLIVEKDYEIDDKNNSQDDQDDDDVSYYTDENEEENRDDEKSKKFDFTKPRPTRAFALSKAAATKKLLTASDIDRFKYKPKTQTAQRLTQRNAAQFRSVRLTNVKGDSLAYITDRQMAKNDRILKKDESGLNEKMTNLKKLSPIKLRTTKKEGKSSEKSNDGVKSRQLFRKSLLIDDEIEEANDVLGPLPSDLISASSASTSTGYSSSASSHFAYDNPAVDFSSDEMKEYESSVRKSQLVSSKVENLPDEETDEDNRNSDIEEASSTTAAEYATYNVQTQSIVSNAPDCLSSDIATPSKRRSLSLDEYQTDFEPNDPLKQACEVTDGYLKNPDAFPANVKPECALQYLQHEWLKCAARKTSNAKYVEQFLNFIQSYGRQLLHKIVNLCDQNENTALHYAVSHCNFDVVSLLLDTKVYNLNKPNKAGYTPVMLAALCPVNGQTDALVIQRLFEMGDVNIKASQHGQTALMLAVSHGKMETTRMLIEAGAGLNIQDEDGSTALMCAAEHGHLEIVRLLLSNQEIDATLADYDGSTALSIAVENGHKDIGVLIYAHLNYARTPSSIKSQSAPVWC